MDEFKTYIVYFVPHRAAPTWTTKEATSRKAVLEGFDWTETTAEAILAIYPEQDDPGRNDRSKWAQDLKDAADELAEIQRAHVRNLSAELNEIREQLDTPLDTDAEV